MRLFIKNWGIIISLSWTIFYVSEAIVYVLVCLKIFWFSLFSSRKKVPHVPHKVLIRFYQSLEAQFVLKFSPLIPCFFFFFRCQKYSAFKIFKFFRYGSALEFAEGGTENLGWHSATWLPEKGYYPIYWSSEWIGQLESSLLYAQFRNSWGYWKFV